MYETCFDRYCPPERRARRFKYRHSAQAAAREVGIPVIWIWYWAFKGRLRSRMWVGEPWFRLEHVEEVAKIDALDTFLATRSYLSESERRGVLRRFPWVEKELARREKRLRRLTQASMPHTEERERSQQVG